MEADNSSNILNKTISLLTKNSKFHILIHDTSGILGYEQLKLAMKYKVHFCDFCDAAKTTDRGLRFCYKCKKLSMKKANLARDLYISQCYLGISEIIKPVYYNDTLLCLIYITNLVLKDDFDNIRKRIFKRTEYTKANKDLLLEKISDCEILDINELKNYIDIIGVLEHIILHCDIPYNSLSFKAFSPFSNLDTKKHILIEDITHYIAANYHQEISLKYLSKLYFIDEQYLCKLFKKETGIGFIDFVNKTRIDHAKRLLTNSNNSISSIALDVGYSNVSHFNRIFKRLTGCTPKEFRTQKSF